MKERRAVGLKLGAIALIVGALPVGLQLHRTWFGNQALAQENSEHVQPVAEASTPDDVQESLHCPSEAEMRQNRIESGVTAADLEAFEAEHRQRMDPEVLPSGEIIYHTAVSSVWQSSNGALACLLDSHTESMLNSGEATYIGGPLDNQ
ncbi:MAG: hypothetical protein AAGJ69_09795 [Cyanobacteria bacterium J06559_1]